MPKLKPSKIPPPVNPHVRKIVVSVRFSSEEMREMLGRAHVWTGGNVSEFIRIAALKFKK